MSARFPHPCNHCGLCCITATCPVGQHLMRVAPDGPCPALEWDAQNPEQSRCGLLTHPEHYLPHDFLALLPSLPVPLPTLLGSGEGCCIAATVIVDGTPADFASLPSETKTALVTRLRHQRGLLLARHPTPTPHHPQHPRPPQDPG